MGKSYVDSFKMQFFVESIEFAAGDGVLFLLGAEVGGEQVAGVLGEMDQIDRGAALIVEFGDFFLELGGGLIGP